MAGSVNSLFPLRSRPLQGSTVWGPRLQKAVPLRSADRSRVFGDRAQVQRWPWRIWEKESPVCGRQREVKIDSWLPGLVLHSENVARVDL